jgi:hypothetical protein
VSRNRHAEMQDYRRRGCIGGQTWFGLDQMGRWLLVRHGLATTTDYAERLIADDDMRNRMARAYLQRTSSYQRSPHIDYSAINA